MHQWKFCTIEQTNETKKKTKTKTSNTCTLSVYTDLDELRLWSVVFIHSLGSGKWEGKKTFFQTSFVSETPKQHTGQCIYLHQATSLDDQKKKPIKNIMPTTKKVYLHVQLIYN